MYMHWGHVSVSGIMFAESSYGIMKIVIRRWMHVCDSPKFSFFTFLWLFPVGSDS